MIHHICLNIIAAAAMMLGSCSGRPGAKASEATPPEVTKESAFMPAFDADTAYGYVARQVEMGPRVPGSQSIAQCGKWIESELRRHGVDTVVVQLAETEDPRDPSRQLPIVNILGRYNLGAKTRVMLVAHYDTRPVADEETDPAKASKPIPGANDGASGVGVMLEVARQLAKANIDVGVDLLFVDLEDSGTSGDDTSWCKGSTYFAEHLPYKSASEMPQAAIVLDMVGGRGARFHREGFSQYYNPALVARVWDSARRTGNANYFPTEDGAPILDDHLPLLRVGIPAIDIVESRSEATGGFPPTWHTHDDDLKNIDPSTLKAVGQTIIHFIYHFR
ncbi:MAG: M28 family peptidase [Pseudoflavonifractor sp.]|nr:M28 family peptidase [Alloprevotella sp.]MCM1116811.1 M28 family peptidase [Pseudoflavonifractor sp.]